MPDYRRNRVPGGTYFFTVNLLERRSCQLVDHIESFRDAVRKVRAQRPFHIDAWVVLPDHTHCVWTLPPGDDDYSARWKAIKIAFAKTLPGTERLSAVRERPISSSPATQACGNSEPFSSSISRASSCRVRNFTPLGT